MTGSANNDVSQDAPKHNHSSAPNELEEIRRLLFEPELVQVRKVQERLDNLQLNTENLSAVIPDAIAKRSLPDKELTEALLPTIENAIHTSVKNDVDIIATAIFPALLPGIRKAVAAAISEMTQSLNQTLDHSFSTKSLKWRLEALFTGKTFAEVVFLHTLLYRVEQVFLIHKETGLVLQHLVAPAVDAQDADMVSGMLTAIRNFIQDSFSVDKNDSLDALRFGELALWIEQGSQAILAGVIRGNAPKELRLVFQDTLNTIHLKQSRALVNFNGDATPFEENQEQLETCLLAQYEPTAQKPSHLLWVVLGAIGVALSTWAGFSIRDSWRWANYLEKLNATPGIVITKAEKHWGKYYISGLRDPLAASPTMIMQTTKINPQDVISQWKPYISLEPALLLVRVKTLLQPPATVVLNIDENGMLSATGSASHKWIVSARKQLQMIPGVNQFQEKNLIDKDLIKFAYSQKQIEQQVLHFEPNTVQIALDQSDTFQKLVQELKTLLESASSLNKEVRVKIIGHTDKQGTDRSNLILSQSRANLVLSTLVSQGFNPNTFETIGVGSTEPVKQELSLQKLEIERSVSFKIIVTDSMNSSTP